MGQHRPCAEPCVVSGGTAQSSGLTRESWAPGRTPDLYSGVASPLPCASLEHAWGLSPRRGGQLGASEKQCRAGILWNLTGEVQPELEEKLILGQDQVRPLSFRKFHRRCCARAPPPPPPPSTHPPGRPALCSLPFHRPHTVSPGWSLWTLVNFVL